MVLHERLPWQRKTQQENLALLVATMLSERSANLMSLAAALPRQPGHRQLGGRTACETRLSQAGGRDDHACLPELCRLPVPG